MLKQWMFQFLFAAILGIICFLLFSNLISVVFTFFVVLFGKRNHDSPFWHTKIGKAIYILITFIALIGFIYYTIKAHVGMAGKIMVWILVVVVFYLEKLEKNMMNRNKQQITD